MRLYTNDMRIYDVKEVEFLEENERLLLATTKDGKELKIELSNFNKVKE